jgi:hypothetical protein
VADKITVHGLKEAVHGLHKIENDVPKAVTIAFNGAADLIIGKARPLVPRRTGAAQGSLKARSTPRDVQISFGGPKAPYYPWLDFGGRTGRKGSARRPFIREGRYLYPTAVKYHPQIVDLMQDAVTKLVRDAGLDVGS